MISACRSGCASCQHPNKAVEHARNDDDPINHPSHYTYGKIEAIEVINDWKLTYCLGNAVAYICRAPHKGQQIMDLKKAAWFLKREIERLEKEALLHDDDQRRAPAPL